MQNLLKRIETVNQKKGIVKKRERRVFKKNTDKTQETIDSKASNKGLRRWKKSKENCRKGHHCAEPTQAELRHLYKKKSRRRKRGLGEKNLQIFAANQLPAWGWENAWGRAMNPFGKPPETLRIKRRGRALVTGSMHLSGQAGKDEKGERGDTV